MSLCVLEAAMKPLTAYSLQSVYAKCVHKPEASNES
jgi:hypothetical protein